MLKFFRIAIFTLLAALAANSGYAADKPVAPAKTAADTSAVVNGVVIQMSHVDMRVKALVAQGQQDSPELRKAVREELINMEIMTQEAVKMGFDKQEETKRQLDQSRKSVLIGAFIQDYLKNNPISDDTIMQEYEKAKQTTGGKQYKARHILVAEENEAKSIAAQLKKGAKFDNLVNKHSLDPGSNKNGGVSGDKGGWSMAANFVQPFADALATLKKGGVSAPVKTEFGWYIIKLDDVRNFKFPPLLEVRQSLVQHLQQQAILKAVAELRTTAKIE